MLFASAFNGAAHIEVFESKLEKKQNLIKMAGASKSYDKETKSYIFDANTVQLPSNSKVELGLKQSFLVLQCQIPQGSPINIEVGIKTSNNTKKWLMFASAFKEISINTFHIKIPLEQGIPRDTWMNICFDLASFLNLEGVQFGYISLVNIRNSIKLRKIFTLKQPVLSYDLGTGGNGYGKLMLPKALSFPDASYNIDVNPGFVESPFLSKEDDRSTHIATPNSGATGTKYSLRKTDKSPNFGSGRKIDQDGRISVPIKAKEFQFEFEVSDKTLPLSHKSGASKHDSRRRTANNGMRVIQRQEQPKQRRGASRSKKAPNELVFKGGENDLMTVGQQKLMLRKMHKEERKRKQLNEEDNYDEFQFSEKVDDEQNHNVHLPKARDSLHSHKTNDYDDLESFEKLEQEVLNNNLSSKFNNTGNHEDYFRNGLNHVEEIMEQIDDDIQGEYPSEFREPDTKTLDSSKDRIPELDKTTRLDKFSKVKQHGQQDMDELLEQMRHTNIVDLDDYTLNNSNLQDSLERLPPKRTPVRDITTFVEELIGNQGAEFRPYSPPASNLIDLVDPNKSVFTQKQGQRVILDFTSKERTVMSDMVEDEGHAELEYDPLLDCYYSPKTNTYHSKK